MMAKVPLAGRTTLFLLYCAYFVCAGVCWFMIFFVSLVCSCLFVLCFFVYFVFVVCFVCLLVVWLFGELDCLFLWCYCCCLLLFVVFLMMCPLICKNKNNNTKNKQHNHQYNKRHKPNIDGQNIDGQSATGVTYNLFRSVSSLFCVFWVCVGLLFI